MKEQIFLNNSLLDEEFLAHYNDNKEVPEILVVDGKTEPVFNYEETIFEKVYVESPQDTDKDGKRDLIAVYIKRPAETKKGMKVPVIYIANPYMLGTNDDLYIGHNVDKDLYVSEETNIKYEDIQYKSEEKNLPAPREVKGQADTAPIEPFTLETTTNWYDYFLVRGYAIVYAGGVGTLDSEGIRSCGSEDETISTIAVIDWLNGRTKAFTNKTDNIEIKANWCTGNVAMTGKSYLGTLCIAAATTGVEGLKTIIPEAAISNWYEYYRCNGLTVPGIGWQGDDADLLAEYCLSRRFDKEDYSKIKDSYDVFLENMRKEQDRVTGNYNKFWDERNYLNNVDKIKASVFIVHGLNDWNVKPKQCDMLWRELEKYDVPRKMILHQGEHIYINNLKGIDYTNIMNKWFAYWLYGIENNIMDEIPNVIIQNNAYIEKWDNSSTWPFENSKHVNLYIDKNKKLSNNREKEKNIEKFTDDLTLSCFDRKNPDLPKWLNTIVDNPTTKREDRIAYVTDTLNEDLRVSGTVNLSLKVAVDKPTGILSAMLVDYGTEHRAKLETSVIVKDGFVFDRNAGKMDIVDFELEPNETKYRVITRGWMNLQNRTNNYNKEKVVPGEEYKVQFSMQPMDYTVLKGHKLGLIIYSTDAEATQRPFVVTNFQIDSSSIELQVPVVNGEIK